MAKDEIVRDDPDIQEAMRRAFGRQQPADAGAPNDAALPPSITEEEAREIMARQEDLRRRLREEADL